MQDKEKQINLYNEGSRFLSMSKIRCGIVKTVDQLLTSLGVKGYEFMINYDIFNKKEA